MSRRALAALACLMLLAAGCGGGSDRVVVAAGTTLVDSGILGEVVAAYEESHPGVQLSVVGDSTARALELGRQGAADLLLTHAPALEDAFIAEGNAARHAPVLESRFLVLGPPEHLAAMSGGTPEDTLAAVAFTPFPFVSRGDGSGTHAKELEIWASAGIDPGEAEWYAETGQGMGLTLQVAEGRRAATIAEEGSYLAAAGLLTLRPVEVTASGVSMSNPYRGIVVEGGAERAAGAFLDWLLSPEGRTAVEAANLARFGRVVYDPVS